LRLIRTTWGILDISNVEHKDPRTWENAFAKLEKEKYWGIEFPVGPFNPFVNDKEKFHELAKKYNLNVIAQIHTCGYPVPTRKVEAHTEWLRKFAREAKTWNAAFINSHSGVDSWSFEESLRFFEEALVIEKEEGITIVHETHRQRILYNPWVTRDLLKKLPDLKINADLSHWVVVAERLFHDERDDDWQEIIELVGKHCHFIHARVGYDEGPQVPEPSAKEYQPALEAHEKWWNSIWKSQQSRGDKFTHVEPEHGPAPYMHTLPHTNVPVADLWQVNSWIANRLSSKYFPNGTYSNN